MFFGNNLKLLRKRKKFTQDELSLAVSLKRTTINNYENGIGKPSIDNVMAVAKYFKISIDTFLTVDLAKLSESKLCEIERGYDDYIKGTKLRVLPTTVNSENKENIEFVPLKAKAGYTAGYNDPEFISGLSTFQLPFLSKDRKYRTFQIDGDSMLPIPDKSYVTGEYITNWNDVKDGQAYIILTMDEGIVFKIVYNQIRTKKKLLLRSLNSIYKPYEININDVKEIWKFVYYTSPELPEPLIEKDSMMVSMANLQENIHKLMSKVETVISR